MENYIIATEKVNKKMYEMMPEKDNTQILDYEAYESMYSFQRMEQGVKRDTEHMKALGLIFDRLVFDFDDAKCPDLAMEEGRNLQKWFNEQFNGLESELWFSGNKGCHLYVYFEPIPIDNPKEVVEKIYNTLHKDLKRLDTSLKDIYTRLIRTKGSKHQKTNLYKIPINNMTGYNNILDHAKHPIEKIPEKKYNNNILFNEFIKNISDSLKNKKKETVQEFKPVLNNIDLNALKQAFMEVYKEGNMNLTAYPLIHCFRRAGHTTEQIKEFFYSLPVNQNFNQVNMWINTSEKGNLVGIKKLISNWEEAGASEKAINIVHSYFKPKNEDDSLYNEIIYLLEKGKYSKKLIKKIAKYLYTVYNIHRSKTTLSLLQLDTELNAFVPLSIEEFKTFCHDLHFHLDDDEFLKLEKSIRSDVEANYNLIHFNNCIYSMNDLKCYDFKNKDSVYCLTKVPYEYNSITKRDNFMKDFLMSSFENDIDKVKGVLEIIGYLLIDGNPSEKAFFFTGIAGSGKSTLGNIISALFDNKIAVINSNDLNNTHHTANLLGNKLCFVEEPEYNKRFKDFIKTMVSQSSITVNPKGKQEITIPLMEKPKLCMFANTIPLNHVNQALLQKIVIVEFKKSFRNTDKAIPNLHKKIIEDKWSMEWLIYHSLWAYKDMIDNNRGFYWARDENETGNLIDKYSDPISYYIERNYMICYDFYNQGWDNVSDFINMYNVPNYEELSKEIIDWGLSEGVEIPVKNGEIHGRHLTSKIKSAFMLDNDFIDDYGHRNKHTAKLVNNKHKNGSYPLYLIPKKE